MSFEFYAEKIGMTTFFTKDGAALPVTVLRLQDMFLLSQRTIEDHGYEASVVAFGDIKTKNVTKPMKKIFENASLEPKKFIREIPSVSLGQSEKIVIDSITSGTLVNVTAISKGKGFAGAMKRHNFAGLRASHGVSISHRSHGSTGGRQDPGKVFKNKKMAGHMGSTQVTIRNLEVVFFSEADSCIYLKGAVPGANNQNVRLKIA
jgi:large subunit ribosomal protein L3